MILTPIAQIWNIVLIVLLIHVDRFSLTNAQTNIIDVKKWELIIVGQQKINVQTALYSQFVQICKRIAVFRLFRRQPFSNKCKKIGDFECADAKKSFECKYILKPQKICKNPETGTCIDIP